MSARQPIADSDLETLQRETFGYFMHEANVENGLIRASVSMFAPFFPAEVRLFKLSDLVAAKEWIGTKNSCRLKSSA